MSIPLLATKLYIPPPRPHAVLRPRLIKRLNEGLHRKLTLISAPAGFGKTTLLSAWIAELNGLPERRAAWLSLDAGDSDQTRFLAYFIAALQTVAANVGQEVLAVLQSPQPLPVETILTALLNEITTIQGSFVLILDDYHVVDAQAIDQILTFLLEHLPPQMHLVVATREDPSLPLARYRARDQMTELRAADLRFGAGEAADFLNQSMGLTLSVEEIAALETRTEGWIAGLQLAALSLQGHQDARGFIQSFSGSHHFVLDYLVEEVLHQQPERVQDFLLRTSILDRLCGPLCDAVLLDSSISGQETLEYLRQANLFLVPLDNERRWYRYHHLFADLLRQRLHQIVSHTRNEGRGPGDSATELHRRASIWYEENGLETEAFHHALAGKDFERAAHLVELTWPAMDRSRQAATWLGWVKALPDKLVRARPVLSVGVAWALLDGGELEAAEARLRDAEEWLGALSDTHEQPEAVDKEEFGSLPATIASARAYLVLALGDVPGTVKYAQRALDLLPEEDYLRRGIPASLLGLASWASGNLEVAHRSFTEAMVSFQRAGNILFAITGTYSLADIMMAQGHLRAAFNAYQQSRQLAAEQGELVRRGTADLYTGLSELYCEQNDLQAATQHLLTSKELGEHAGLPRWHYRWCLAHARLLEAQGDLDGALNLLDEAERQYVRGPVPEVRPIAARKARVWVRQGRLAEALGWVRERGLAAGDDLSYMCEFEHITLARVLIVRYVNGPEDGSLHEGMELLERLLQAAQAESRMGSAIEILVLQALAHQAQGEIPRALVSLERALTLAEPEGYVRIFVDEGAPMAQLLSAATAQGILPAYTDKLLSAIEAAEQKGTDKTHLPSPVQPRTGSPLIEPLSEREVEVLQLIAQGLSNREIGERLFLALSTVKGHNRNIFGKLGVKRRTEAVARARELGLL